MQPEIYIVSGFVLLSVVLGVLAGGFIYHRGVLTGKGEAGGNFLANPKGEVFRIPMPDDIELGEDQQEAQIKKISSRIDDFKKSLGGAV
ncbi:MAG: hypothetical protein L7F78_05190 [Syntrophales bacterium LBB04]|nr:hypothetical protein [Syntrophales bacterium LBB04]